MVCAECRGRGLPDIVGDQNGGDDAALLKHETPFNDIFQFPHIPGPGVLVQCFAGLWRNMDIRMVLPVEFCQKGVDVEVDVRGSAPQRGELDGDDIQPEIQVCPEALF